MKSQKSKVEIKVVEVPVTIAREEEWDEETSAAVAALETNPGFQALMQRQQLRVAVLETMLKRTRHQSIRDVDILQTGIAWGNWMGTTVEAEVKKRARREVSRGPYDVEEKEFERMKQALTVVGLGNPTPN